MDQLTTDPKVRGGQPCSPRPCWHSGSGHVGGTSVRMSSGQVTCRMGRAALGSELSVDLPGQRPLLAGWWWPPLPHAPRWLPELQKSHQTLGWKKEEGKEKDKSFLGLSVPTLYNGTCSQAVFFCEVLRASSPFLSGCSRKGYEPYLV